MWDTVKKKPTLIHNNLSSVACLKKKWVYQACYKEHLAEQETSESQRWAQLMVALKVPLGLPLVALVALVAAAWLSVVPCPVH